MKLPWTDGKTVYDDSGPDSMVEERLIHPFKKTFFCKECGPRISVDEDGCCTMCGRDAEIYGEIQEKKERQCRDCRYAITEFRPRLRLLCQFPRRDFPREIKCCAFAGHHNAVTIGLGCPEWCPMKGKE